MASLLQRQYRLEKNRQFSYVYRRGARVSCKDLSLLYVKSRQKKVGFSVSKKVGGAVVRNLVKRRLRECFRGKMPTLPGGLYVVVARPTAKDCTFQQLARSVDLLLHRLSLKPAYPDHKAGQT